MLKAVIDLQVDALEPYDFNFGTYAVSCHRPSWQISNSDMNGCLLLPPHELAKGRDRRFRYPVSIHFESM